MDNVQYSTWAEPFKIPARSHRVIDHIIPMAKGKENFSNTKLWPNIDASILKWIYSTIPHYILHIILKPETTTMEDLNILSDIFKDNKHSHVVILGIFI